MTEIHPVYTHTHIHTHIYTHMHIHTYTYTVCITPIYSRMNKGSMTMEYTVLYTHTYRWNKLPPQLRNKNISINIFKKKLKKFLIAQH